MTYTHKNNSMKKTKSIISNFHYPKCDIIFWNTFWISFNYMTQHKSLRETRLHVWYLCSSPSHIEDSCEKAIANCLQPSRFIAKNNTRNTSSKYRRERNGNQNRTCCMPYLKMPKPVYLWQTSKKQTDAN